jgi:hypothetical protein
MTATVTSLFELASAHGFGVAILIIGAQVVLDRLLPVEYLVTHLFGPRRSAPGRGAHRRVPAPQPSWASRLASSLTPDRNNELHCME